MKKKKPIKNRKKLQVYLIIKKGIKKLIFCITSLVI